MKKAEPKFLYPKKRSWIPECAVSDFIKADHMRSKQATKYYGKHKRYKSS